MSKILIFGDICPVDSTAAAFRSGMPDRILGEGILHLIDESDYVIGNLECALTDNPCPIKKAGPVLFAPTDTAEMLARCGFRALSLANNHIRDCGHSGVASTLEACHKHNIKTFGAGISQAEAKKPVIVEIDGQRIAFLSFAEQEFNIGHDGKLGSAYFDVYDDFDYIRTIRNSVDYLIILYHGGIEYHPYPSPLLQKRCRKFADSGADIVLCQHSHCVGSYEYWSDSFILYGQGNNIYGHRKNNPGWNDGLLVSVEISKNKPSVNLIPCTTDINNIFDRLPQKQSDDILKDVRERSYHICDYQFVLNKWYDFCNDIQNLNIPLLIGWPKFMIRINRMTSGLLAKFIYGRKRRNITNNMIRCESHNEVMRTILDHYNYE